VDEDTATDGATTDYSVSELSPGGPDIEFGVSTGGLDFMSSSGYPQIEFGYDDATDEDDGDSDSEDETPSTDGQPPNGGNKVPQLVSEVLVLELVPYIFNPYLHKTLYL